MDKKREKCGDICIILQGLLFGKTINLKNQLCDISIAFRLLRSLSIRLVRSPGPGDLRLIR